MATFGRRIVAYLGLLPEGADVYFHALSAFVVFLSAIETITIGLSLAELSVSRLVASGILMAAAIAAWATWRMLRRQAREGSREGQTYAFGSQVPFALTGACALVYLVLWLLSLAQPDTSFDGTAYHIPTIHFWALKGYVHWITADLPAISFMNGYPKGAELIGFVFFRAFDSSNLVNVSNLLFLPLGVLGIIYLARELGASSKMALLAGSAFILIPVNIAQAFTTNVDSGYASSAIGFIAAVVYANTVISHKPLLSWTVLLSLGGTLGLTMGTKSSGVVLAAVGLLALVVLLLLKLVTGPRENRYRPFAGSIAFLVAVAAIAMAVGGYWYLRNYLMRGSPLYPAGISIGGHTVFPGLPVEQTLSEIQNTPVELRSWPRFTRFVFTWMQGLWEWPQSIRSADSRLGGLGYLWALGCVPSILFLAYRWIRHQHPRDHLGSSLLLLAVVGLVFLVTPMNWWARYTIWIYALGLPYLAVLFDRVYRGRQARTLARVWTSVVVGVLIIEGGISVYDVIRLAYPSSPLSGAVSGQALQRSVASVFPGLRGTVFDRILAYSDAVAIGPLDPSESRLVGLLSFPIGRRDIVALGEIVTKESIDQILLHKVRYLVLDDKLEMPLGLRRLSSRMDHVPPFAVLTVADDLSGSSGIVTGQSMPFAPDDMPWDPKKYGLGTSYSGLGNGATTLFAPLVMKNAYGGWRTVIDLHNAG